MLVIAPATSMPKMSRHGAAGRAPVSLAASRSVSLARVCSSSMHGPSLATNIQLVKANSLASSPRNKANHSAKITKLSSSSVSSTALLPHQLASMPISFCAGGNDHAKRILCYGDSLTVGFFAGGAQFAPYGRAMIQNMAAAGIASECSICGHSGVTAKEMRTSSHSTVVDVVGGQGKGLARILKDDAAYDFVVIMAGTNDMGKGTPLEYIVEDLRSLHEICHATGTRTVALAPPPAPGQPFARELERRCLISRLEKLCSEMDDMVACVDPAQFTPMSNRRFWENDGVHFSPAGSHALGQGLATLAVEYFSIVSPKRFSGTAKDRLMAEAGVSSLSYPLQGKSIRTFQDSARERTTLNRAFASTTLARIQSGPLLGARAVRSY